MRASLGRIRWLVRKELWQFRADKLYTFMLVGLPLLQLFLVVGIMSDEGGRGSPIAVLDQDQSAASRALVAAIENTGEAWVRLWPENLAEGDQALRAGQAEGLLAIPPGFQQGLRGLPAGRPVPSLLVVVDGTNSWSGSTVLGTIAGAISGSLSDVLGANQGGLALRPTNYFDIAKVQDPVSSQLGFLLYQVVLMVSAPALAREREHGTLEQLLVTPLRGLDLIVGKAAPALVVGVVDFLALFAMGRLIWDVPMRGSFALLFIITLLFILAESAWGLFLSSHVGNQQQAVQVIFVQILFDMSFCGYVVPIDNLPLFIRRISELLPLRHYLQCVRTVMLRGGNLAAVGYDMAALAVLGLAFWAVAVRTLRRSLR